MFDSLHGRTCLHYAAYYGHSDCLQAILSAAHFTPVADSWLVPPSLSLSLSLFLCLSASVGFTSVVNNLHWVALVGDLQDL